MTKIYLLKGECHYFHTRACVLMKLLNLDPELHAADMHGFDFAEIFDRKVRKF